MRYYESRGLLEEIYYVHQFEPAKANEFNLLNTKTIAKNFVSSLGVACVPQLCNFKPIDRLPLRSGMVVKPSFEANSRGVFIIKAEDEIIDLHGDRRIFSYEELRAVASSYVAQKIVRFDRWNAEALVIGKNNSLPPYEVKFFCFYGRVGMVLERKVDPALSALGYRRTYYNESRQVFYSDQVDSKLIEPVLPERYYESALAISKFLPIPFIRIDFIRTDDGLLFSEFELMPGSLRHLPPDLLQETNLRLGVMYRETDRLLRSDESATAVQRKRLLEFALPPTEARA